MDTKILCLVLLYLHLLLVLHQPPDVLPLLEVLLEPCESGAGGVIGVEEEVLGLGHSVYRHWLPGQLLRPPHVVTITWRKQTWGHNFSELTK